MFYVNELITINKYQNCQIFGLALSDKFQQLQLEKNEDTDAAGSVIKNLRPNYFNKQETILGIDLDSLPLNNKIGFIKIDVEGAELEVLLGMKNMLKKDRPMITYEIFDSY